MILSQSPIVKDRLTGEKQKKFNNMYLYTIYIPPVYMGETEENWVTLQNGPSHHLKDHLHLKTKENVGGKSVEPVIGGYQIKQSKQRHSCYVDLSPCLLHW